MMPMPKALNPLTSLKATPAGLPRYLVSLNLDAYRFFVSIVSDNAVIDMPKARTIFNAPEACVQFAASQRACTIGLYTAVYTQPIQPRTVTSLVMRPFNFLTMVR